MAWSAPKSWATGYKVLASDMNSFVSDNDAALRGGGIAITSQAANDVVYATSATQLGRLAAGTDGHFLKTQGAGSAPVWAAATTSPAGSDTQIQYNDSGSFGGDAGLTFNETSNVVSISGGVTIPAAESDTVKVLLENPDGDMDAAITTWNSATSVQICLSANERIDSSGNFARFDTASGRNTSTVDLQPGEVNLRTGNDATSTTRLSINSTGSVTIAGALSKGSGSFNIGHPHPDKHDTHRLVHSFIEGPQCDLIYRGSATLVAGSATVNLDTASTMTEGTWILLCRNEQCFTSNETGWSSVRGNVSQNILTIECEDGASTDTVSWMVVAERHDDHIMETEWTDDDGHVIVEPLNPEPSERHGA